MKYFFIISCAACITVLGILILPRHSFAAGYIYISEVGAYEASNYEWIEIYNSADASIDITGWSFWEQKINHKLTPHQGDLIIESGEYAIIADVAANVALAHPDFSGTIIDSSWESLKESGEEIGLKDDEGNFADLTVYGEASKHSVQRFGESWIEHPSGSSFGKENEITNDNSSQSPVTWEGNTVGERTKPQALITGTVVINEFVSDPAIGEAEWIELYNSNDTDIDLDGWSITEGSASITPLSGIIVGHGYRIIEKPKGSLNNTGDIIILKDSLENIMDEVVYGNYSDKVVLPAPQDPYSLARKGDGLYTGDNINDFSPTQQPTKGSANSISLPTPIQDEVSKYIQVTKKGVIVINELFPNPPGSDQEYEFIEIQNTGGAPVQLDGWKLQNKTKRNYIFPNFSLAPHSVYTVDRRISGIPLNNNGDTITLFDESGAVADSFSYSQSSENLSIALADSGEWDFEASPTRGVINNISSVNHPPIIVATCPKDVDENSSGLCDASDSYDPDGDQLWFLWDRNGDMFTAPYLDIPFTTKGSYPVLLTVSDGKTEKRKEFKVIVRTNTPADISSELPRQNQSSFEEIKTILPEEVRLLAKGVHVVTQGTVIIPPHFISSQVMYINGVQIYMNKAQWPALQIGDEVIISGVVSEVREQKRINVTTADDIHFIGKGNIDAKPVEIESISSLDVGQLVKVSGTASNLSSSSFVLSDAAHSITVLIKKQSKIPRTAIVEGFSYVVAGVLAVDQNGFVLLPRDITDIEYNGEKQNNDKQDSSSVATVIHARSPEKTMVKYLLPAALVMLISLIVAGKSKNKKVVEGPTILKH